MKWEAPGFSRGEDVTSLNKTDCQTLAAIRMVNALFEVGEKEKHRIMVTACTISEVLKVLVDDKLIFDAAPPRPSKLAQFQIGEQEKHSVEVKVTGTFTCTVKLHVDGKLHSIA
jgi:hypothetical protein